MLNKIVRILIFSITVLSFFSCQKNNALKGTESISTKETFPEKAKDYTIYEVNIRQHTPEGTLKAFSEDMERISNMGVKMLWLMPVQPIGVKNRKDL